MADSTKAYEDGCKKIGAETVQESTDICDSYKTDWWNVRRELYDIHKFDDDMRVVDGMTDNAMRQLSRRIADVLLPFTMDDNLGRKCVNDEDKQHVCEDHTMKSDEIDAAFKVFRQCSLPRFAQKDEKDLEHCPYPAKDGVYCCVFDNYDDKVDQNEQLVQFYKIFSKRIAELATKVRGDDFCQDDLNYCKDDADSLQVMTSCHFHNFGNVNGFRNSECSDDFKLKSESNDSSWNVQLMNGFMDDLDQIMFYVKDNKDWGAWESVFSHHHSNNIIHNPEPNWATPASRNATIWVDHATDIMQNSQTNGENLAHLWAVNNPWGKITFSAIKQIWNTQETSSHAGFDGAGVELVRPKHMWDQLCDGFIKSSTAGNGYIKICHNQDCTEPFPTECGAAFTYKNTQRDFSEGQGSEAYACPANYRYSAQCVRETSKELTDKDDHSHVRPCYKITEDDTLDNNLEDVCVHYQRTEIVMEARQFGDNANKDTPDHYRGINARFTAPYYNCQYDMNCGFRFDSSGVCGSIKNYCGQFKYTYETDNKFDKEFQTGCDTAKYPWQQMNYPADRDSAEPNPYYNVYDNGDKLKVVKLSTDKTAKCRGEEGENTQFCVQNKEQNNYVPCDQWGVVTREDDGYASNHTLQVDYNHAYYVEGVEHGKHDDGQNTYRRGPHYRNPRKCVAKTENVDGGSLTCRFRDGFTCMNTNNTCHGNGWRRDDSLDGPDNACSYSSDDWFCSYAGDCEDNDSWDCTGSNVGNKTRIN